MSFKIDPQNYHLILHTHKDEESQKLSRDIVYSFSILCRHHKQQIPNDYSTFQQMSRTQTLKPAA